MSEPMRELRVRFTGDAGDLTRAARDAERAMREVERTQEQTGISAAELGKKLGGLAVAYLSLDAAARAAQKGLQGLASIEQSELTFKVLFGSAEQAKAKMQELVQFAAKTPFELPGIVDAAKKLETFGLSSTKYLKDAGDLAAAFNVEISEVASAFGRLNSGDFGEAFERLRDFGIARRDLEGEGLVFDKSGSYQGSVDQALTAVQTIIRKKFGGMMEEQSKTFGGQMSTLADNVQTALNTVMTPSFATLTAEVSKLNTALDGTFGEEMQKDLKMVGDIVGAITSSMTLLGSAVGGTFREMMEPLRWFRDAANVLGKGLGQREVLRNRVLSDTVNFPNQARRERYAKLIGDGNDLGNIGNDFMVKSWAMGNRGGINEELGKLAVIMADVKAVVNGTKQYSNYERFGPPLPPGGVTRTATTTTTTTTGGTTSGKGAPTAPYGSQLIYGPGYGGDFIAFQEREAQRLEDLGVRIEREATQGAKAFYRAQKPTSSGRDEISPWTGLGYDALYTGSHMASSLARGDGLSAGDMSRGAGGLLGGTLGILGGPAGMALGASLGSALGDVLGGWFDGQDETAQKLKDAAESQKQAANDQMKAARRALTERYADLELNSRDLELQLQQSRGLITDDQAGLMRAGFQADDLINSTLKTVAEQFYGGETLGGSMAQVAFEKVKAGGSASDVGSYEVYSLLQAALRNADLIRQNAQAQYGATAGIGSMSNPDTALQFDAPATRNFALTQTIAINTYAVTGDKASFRALVKEVMAEANTLLGQSV